MMASSAIIAPVQLTDKKQVSVEDGDALLFYFLNICCLLFIYIYFYFFLKTATIVKSAMFHRLESLR